MSTVIGADFVLGDLAQVYPALVGEGCPAFVQRGRCFVLTVVGADFVPAMEQVRPLVSTTKAQLLCTVVGADSTLVWRKFIAP